ncbi:hypothetical protein FQR65_LT20316 [Abscondita terminalis]|nr:hypothetical protein FQR65_LT20316 [Abscondita terminalis]
MKRGLVDRIPNMRPSSRQTCSPRSEMRVAHDAALYEEMPKFAPAQAGHSQSFAECPGRDSPACAGSGQPAGHVPRARWNESDAARRASSPMSPRQGVARWAWGGQENRRRAWSPRRPGQSGRRRGALTPHAPQHIGFRHMANILVVDDELGIRDLLSEILNDEGHSVDVAENARRHSTARSIH